jgi:hypothetical protein
MLQAELLDWLDMTVRRMLRKPHQPFGGIQLVFAGGTDLNTSTADQSFGL